MCSIRQRHDVRAHRIRERDQPSQRTHHAGDALDQILRVEANELQSLHGALPNASAEDKRETPLGAKLVRNFYVFKAIAQDGKQAQDGVLPGEGSMEGRAVELN